MARKVKVAELAGADLDLMVAMCAGLNAVIIAAAEGPRCVIPGRGQGANGNIAGVHYCPSGNWLDGGPIVDREGIDTRQIKRPLHRLIELRHFCAERGDAIVRPPGWNRDMVRRPITPSSIQGQWLARLADSSGTTTRWSLDTDFLGPTLLVAAMRCYVASKMGREVEVANHPRERRDTP